MEVVAATTGAIVAATTGAIVAATTGAIVAATTGIKMIRSRQNFVPARGAGLSGRGLA
jgi:hypothetical protein